MTLERQPDDSLRVELSAAELQHFELTYATVQYENRQTRRMLRAVLQNAGSLTGFSGRAGPLTIEVFPAPKGGCVLFFSHRPAEKKRGRGRPSRLYGFAGSEALMAAMESLPPGGRGVASELYEHEGRYYLVAQQPLPLLEYAAPMAATRLTLARLREYGRLLAAPNAVEALCRAMNPQP